MVATILTCLRTSGPGGRAKIVALAVALILTVKLVKWAKRWID